MLLLCTSPSSVFSENNRAKSPVASCGRVRTKMPEPGQGKEIGWNQEGLLFVQGTNPAVCPPLDLGATGRENQNGKHEDTTLPL